MTLTGVLNYQNWLEMTKIKIKVVMNYKNGTKCPGCETVTGDKGWFTAQGSMPRKSVLTCRPIKGST